MKVTVDAIKLLREKTGVGIMECKWALEEAKGDTAKAEEVLRQRGSSKAAKKAGRETRNGLVEAYIHSGNRVGALVEVNCETDFVARTSEFRDLAHNLAMQVAAMSPEYVEAGGKPSEDARSPQEVCLMEQPFIRDPSRTVRELVQDVIARVGENVRVRRFARFALGE